MLKDIFRKDLELTKKWWHRMFKVIFFMSLLFFSWQYYLQFLEDSFNHYKRVENLEDRLSDGVSKIEKLLGYGEKFDGSGWGDEEDYWNEDIYCSNKLYDINNLNYIILDSGIDNFDRLYQNEHKTSVEDFSIYIRKNNIKCITKDNAELNFLNPMDYFNDFGFYQKSRIQYLKDSVFLWQLLLNFLVYILFVYFIYYKLIMYIIYGNKKQS